MYDLPEVAEATRAWWQGLAAAFRRQGLEGVPRDITEGDEGASLWHAPDLLFSQCCGYDLCFGEHGAAGAPTLVATPAYDFPACTGARYRSVIAVREEEPAAELADLRGRRAAVNYPGSHSGYNVLRAMIAPLATDGRFFSDVLVSGSHRASVAALREGRADIAAIDGVTYGLLERHAPGALSGVRALCLSPAAPGLPYITRPGASADRLARLRAGLFEALENPDLADAREALGLAGAEVLGREAYRAIETMAEEARSAGYPEIA